jgi:DNA-binding transcriptional LysR family regulator
MRFRMAVENFDWALIKSFLAVLDAGSLMGAARKIGAQQPTLSRHIAELEAQLGAPLFERTGRGVSPTAVALAIAEPARLMESGADTLARALAGQRSATTGTVRITTSQVAGVYLLPELIAQLRLIEPGIQIELVTSNQLTNLLRREADIAVRMVRPTQGSLVARKLGEVAIVAAAHRSYLDRVGRPKKPEDLRRHQLIGYDRDETMERGMARMGFPVPHQAFSVRTDDQVAYGHLLARGAGIGFIAQYNLAHLAGVEQVLPMLRIPPLPCWLAVHREIRSNPMVRKVFDFLAEAIPRELEAP